MLGLTSTQGASGVDGAECIFDIRVFIPTHPAIVLPRSHPCSDDMNLRKSESMEIVFELLNLPHFTPLVFSTFGGLGREASIFYSRLADLLASKHSSDFSHMLSWMRCTLSFSLLRSAILAIRGSRTIKFSERPSISTELCLVKAKLIFQYSLLIVFVLLF